MKFGQHGALRAARPLRENWRQGRAAAGAARVLLKCTASRAAVPCASRLREHVRFHEQTDFEWDDLRRREEHRLAETLDAACAPEVSDESQLEAWERHHQLHANAPLPFFRERRYLVHQFPQLLASPLRLLEVGCGNGSSTLPVLRANADARVHATDVSPAAIALTRAVARREGFEDRITTAAVGALDPAGGVASGFDAALLVFTASAVPAGGDLELLRRVADSLRPGGQALTLSLTLTLT